jgi:hypothetical protein
MSKIHLHIDSLSLPGYSPADRRAFLAALEREMAARVQKGATAPANAHREAVRVSTTDLRPHSVAQNIARNVTQGLADGKNPVRGDRR